MGYRDDGNDKGCFSAANTQTKYQGLLGVWSARTFGQRLPQGTPGPGKRRGARIKENMWNQAQRLPNQTTALLPPTQTSEEGARQHSRGSQTLRSPEEDDSTGVEPVVAVGRAGGDSCYVPVDVEGVPCAALVDTGSTVTLVRADVLPSGTMFEPTSVRLRTVTGELAAMKGRGVLSVSVGGVEVRHPVWIADVQDPCILGLDFLKATGCLLDLQAGTVSFRVGPVITMTRIHNPAEPAGRPPTPTVSTLEIEENPLSVPVSPVTPTQDNSPPVTPGLRHPSTAPPQLPQTEVEEAQSAVLEVWRKNCGGLNPEQQEQLGQLLLEFQGSFAMKEEEVGRTHLVEHEIDTGDSRPIRCRPRRLPLARLPLPTI
ncbi:uncharacterized protein LOC117552165 [Gymnodraco acuticeps]|uniref:Uncharacterized protein LOC117552165 n=1 Tax=Gymnodraco acuticeps TaxID=8218 RepID=A0A6P8W110_GYMAC|nr:uncharacterized protein LOC117552165 [Gymnodraco acuticeps]